MASIDFFEEVSICVAYDKLLFMNANYQEENPFETELVASEWSYSIENEKGMIRDKELYPLLSEWIKNTNAENILDIGSGQGICADRCVPDNMNYTGVEPSVFLTDRANELYKKENRKFILGNAFNLPVATASMDGVFSINVWFHLENLDLAAKELSRVLKTKGVFFISTANPDAYQVFEDLYSESTKVGKKLVGKANVPVRAMSKNILYEHTMQEMKDSFEKHGLKILEIKSFGFAHLKTDKGLFVAIIGEKV